MRQRARGAVAWFLASGAAGRHSHERHSMRLHRCAKCDGNVDAIFAIVATLFVMVICGGWILFRWRSWFGITSRFAPTAKVVVGFYSLLDFGDRSCRVLQHCRFVHVGVCIPPQHLRPVIPLVQSDAVVASNFPPMALMRRGRVAPEPAHRYQTQRCAPNTPAVQSSVVSIHFSNGNCHFQVQRSRWDVVSRGRLHPAHSAAKAQLGTWLLQVKPTPPPCVTQSHSPPCKQAVR